MSLYNVVSTGRGGAGNMVNPHSNQKQQSLNLSNSHHSHHSNHHSHSTIEEEHPENEVIMTEEEFLNYKKRKDDNAHLIETELKKTRSHSGNYHHNRNNHKVHASSGRGGAGNIIEVDSDELNQPKNETHEHELSPIFSTGRGGAGNIYKKKNNCKTKVTMEEELTEQLCPLHSNKSGKSNKSLNNSKVGKYSEEGDESLHHDIGFVKKLKNLFKK